MVVIDWILFWSMLELIITLQNTIICCFSSRKLLDYAVMWGKSQRLQIRFEKVMYLVSLSIALPYFWGFVAKLNVKIIQMHRYSIDDLLIQWFLVIHKRHVHSYHHFESQKAYKHHKMNTVSWEYIEVLMPQGRGNVLLPVCAFLTLKVTVAIDMHFMN